MWRLAYRTFRAIAGIQYWLERHFTRTGWLVAAGALGAGALGVDTNQTVAYQVFTLLAALLLVAAAASGFVRTRCSIARDLPRMVTAGQKFDYRLRVVNQGSRPLADAVLLEGLSDFRPSFAEFRRQLRLPTYRGWQRLSRGNQILRVAASTLPPLAPRAEVEIAATAEVYRRGVAHFETVTLARADPLGIFRGLNVVREPANVLVLPRRYELPLFQLPGSRRYQPGGVTQASSVGESEEFVGLRDYRPGDPLQRIHWKSFARAGEPIVREYQDEFFERHALVLDTFGGVADAASFEEAVSIAASFACTISAQECLLDLVFVGAEAYCYTAGRGQLPTANLVEILAGVQPCADKPFRLLHDAVLAQRAILTGCICILLAWDAPRQEFIRQLRALGVPLRALVVTAGEIADRPEWLFALEPGKIQEGLAGL